VPSDGAWRAGCENRHADRSGSFERALGDAREVLDHRMLNDVENLGPPTLENLSAWIWRRLAPTV